MTPDIQSPPLPSTLDLSGLPEGVVRQVTAIVAAARQDPAAPGPTAAPPDPLHLLPLPLDQMLAELEAWRRDAAARAHWYPPGHVLDDSRETIYGERDPEPT